MSVSLLSTESIIDTANRFYNKNLPLSYSQKYHLPILLNIIGYVTHERTLSVVFTSVPLIEPIYNRNNIIILSKSVIAYYMNQPIFIDRGKIEFEHNVDLFDGLMDMGNANAFPTKEPFNEDEYVKFVNVVRLVIMVFHWYQHYKYEIPYTDHAKFKIPEIANRKFGLYKAAKDFAVRETDSNDSDDDTNNNGVG